MWSWIAAGVSEKFAEDLYDQARAGVDPPEWFKDMVPSPPIARVVGWNEYNPVWHLWRWMGTNEAGEGAGVALEEFPDLRAKMLERWNVEFWIPLYQAVCDLPYPDYVASLHAIFPVVNEVFNVYGGAFVAPWYASIVEGELVLNAVDAREYVRRRSDLSCFSVPVETAKDSTLASLIPDVVAPFVPAFPAIEKKFPWAWTAFGVLVATAAIALVTRPRTKKRRRKKR